MRLSSRAALIISCFLLVLSDARAEDPLIRVRIADSIYSCLISIDGGYDVLDNRTGEVISFAESLPVTKVTVSSRGIKIGSQELAADAISIVPSGDAEANVDGKKFRGSIDIVKTKKARLVIINHIGLENYLYGVLYSEMPHYWPMEALMAQAIAARTYAVYKTVEMKNSLYDVTNDTFSQMYGGKKSERWRTKWAVDLTRGKVLKFNGQILPAYFNACCGGYTEDAGALWNVDLAPLKGLKCDFCKIYPKFNWKYMTTLSDIERGLKAEGVKCEGISYIVPGKRDASGRVIDVRVKDMSGVIDVSAKEFRHAVGTSKMKSTKFDIEIDPFHVIIKGTGLGHGVGFCQWGALGMALKGFTYKEILAFYYPGSSIEDL